MQISIIGDSWGEPNWRFPTDAYSASGHISCRLHRAGHTVYNSSQAGGSNLSTFTHAANWTVHRDSELVIWFHTELSRNMSHPIGNHWFYEQELSRVAHTVYQQCRDAFKVTFPKAQLWVIEGQSPVVSPQFYQFFKPRFFTKDWRSRLVGRQLPQTQLIGALSHYPFFDGCDDSHRQKMLWTQEVELVLTHMRRSHYFSDDCHPNDLAHEELFEEALTVIQECMQQPMWDKQIQGLST